MSIAPEVAYAIRPPNFGLTEAQRREAVRAYYATITFLDVQIGKVLDALDRLKLTDKTTIVFWSDHGYQLGEHGQWMKQTLWEPSARMPFIVAGGGVRSRGRNTARTVELLDVYPTLAELCGLGGTPRNLHGRSLKPILDNPSASWMKPAVTQVQRRGAELAPAMGYSIRNERYRYSMWNDGALGEEVYDYETDPREMKNLASDEKIRGLKAQMKAQLEGILRARGRTA
jgi:uncharacterized sulfatase